MFRNLKANPIHITKSVDGVLGKSKEERVIKTTAQN